MRLKGVFKAVTVTSVVDMTTSLLIGLWYYSTFGIKPEGVVYTWGFRQPCLAPLTFRDINGLATLTT
ncbi:MAG: hypothetical protein QW057_05670 [Candidatus Bathyarchaeia archaeon]